MVHIMFISTSMQIYEPQYISICIHIPAAHDSNSRNPITAAIPEAIVVATNLLSISFLFLILVLESLTQGIFCFSKQAICPARSQTSC